MSYNQECGINITNQEKLHDLKYLAPGWETQTLKASSVKLQHGELTSSSDYLLQQLNMCFYVDHHPASHCSRGSECLSELVLHTKTWIKKRRRPTLTYYMDVIEDTTRIKQK